MNILLAADWHLGHDKLIEKAGRPEDFSGRILRNLRAAPEADVLLFLGDICIRGDEVWHEAIDDAMNQNGAKRWLILGNHDRKTKTWYLQHGWDFVAKELTMDAYGLRLLFTHIPQPPSYDYDINIHGHLHNTGHHPECGLHGQQRLVASEHTYAPINLATLLKGVKKGR